MFGCAYQLSGETDKKFFQKVKKFDFLKKLISTFDHKDSQTPPEVGTKHNINVYLNSFVYRLILIIN